jgi:hypothetical protein
LLILIAALLGGARAFDETILPYAPDKYRLVLRIVLAHPKEPINETLYEEVWTDRTTKQSRTAVAHRLLMDRPIAEELMYVARALRHRRSRPFIISHSHTRAHLSTRAGWTPSS